MKKLFEKLGFGESEEELQEELRSVEGEIERLESNIERKQKEIPQPVEFGRHGHQLQEELKRMVKRDQEELKALKEKREELQEQLK